MIPGIRTPSVTAAQSGRRRCLMTSLEAIPAVSSPDYMPDVRHASAVFLLLDA